MLELLFDNDFYLSGGCRSDEECSEGPCYLGNDELHPRALDRAVTSAGEVTEAAVTNEDDEVMTILCLLFLQRMRIKIRTW